MKKRVTEVRMWMAGTVFLLQSPDTTKRYRLHNCDKLKK